MKLRCLASSSAGNCYLLENESECLVLEAGIPFREVKKALTFDVLKIVGVLCTHEHNDHIGYAKEYVKAGFPIYASQGTADAVGELGKSFNIMRSGYWYQLGKFTITPFRCEHDCPEPFGFIIRHQEIGTLLFATDTSYIKPNFKKLKLNHIMVECNYSEEIVNGYLEKGSINRARVDRTMKTHMEFETCKGFIEANKTSNLDTVTLLHLSDGNSDERKFRDGIQEVVGSNTKVYVADKNVTVNLDVCPF